MRGALGISVVALVLGLAPAAAYAGAIDIRVLSSRADLVSAGDALIQIKLPKGHKPSKLRVTLGRRDVTRAFTFRENRTLRGVLTGLRVGRSTLTARVKGSRRGARLTLTNHPNGGPVFSGPQVQPWRCQEGAVDKQCNQPPVYTYLYRSSDASKPGLQPYDPESPPPDVATTTTDDGVTVPFIVRQEVGYQDRDQYKILTLFEPGKPWDRFAPPKHFAHKLLVTHGGGCGASYGVGEAPLADLSGTLPAPIPGYTDAYILGLGRGFAVMSTALDNNGHNCNLVTQAESLMMAKERVIEQYGDLRYTIGTGCSGGSLAQQQIANAYPGAVYDGLITQCSYPDTLTPGAQFADYHLLRLYFENPGRWGSGIAWSPAQMADVEGHISPANAIVADEGLFKSAVDPANQCNGVSAEQVYNAESNPAGTRCSILDYMINVLGPRPPAVWSANERKLGRGFGGVPFGSEGIQYGLGALQKGQITPAQFVDVNAKIGGLDIDVKPVPERIPGDDTALANAYRSGAINETNNMHLVPIINLSGPDPGAAHDYSHTWWTRLRMQREHGHYRNHILWYGQQPIIGDVAFQGQALVAMDRWLAAIKADRSAKPLEQKILDDKPADIVDRCVQTTGVEISQQCDSPELTTLLGTPRTVGGADPASDQNKCSLKPLRREDYGSVTFSEAEWTTLAQTFPNGVCDWSRPGVGQQDAVAWMEYADAQGRVIYGGRPMVAPPRSKVCRVRRRACR